MSLAPYTEHQQTMIVNNIVCACEDITVLSKMAYKFIHVCSGFIAHYDLHGFKAYYSEHNLKRDILQYVNENKYNNFRPGDDNYDYYMSKKNIYTRIVNILLDKRI